MTIENNKPPFLERLNIRNIEFSFVIFNSDEIPSANSLFKEPFRNYALSLVALVESLIALVASLAGSEMDFDLGVNSLTVFGWRRLIKA